MSKEIKKLETFLFYKRIMFMDKEQFKIIGHSLGINTYHAKHSEIEKDKYLPGEFYRNYFCAGTKGGDEYSILEQLEKDELMISQERHGDMYFFVTDKGIQKFRNDFAIQVTQEFQPPSKGRSKYLDYLHNDGGETFEEFLGILIPKRESGPGGVRFVSTKYSGVMGDFKRTVKEAKVSYKGALKEYKSKS